MYLTVTVKEGMVQTITVGEILQRACTMRRLKGMHSPSGINIQGVREEGGLQSIREVAMGKRGGEPRHQAHTKR